MSTLHTVNKSPFEKSSMDSCLAYAKQGSAVLMYEDGIYGAIKGTAIADKIAAASGVSFYVLGPDLKARGVAEDKVVDGIEIVDYPKFVALAAENDKVQAWV
ncbi:MAG: sulfurtransferase complex subunit TusB [Candidatus Thiodiazotropha lotti]|uniref:Sulfurtransferase complex subunit TusB n=1 Tax=Candidatus Thiodiazotropha lotti TaxID=2792787 RepID=A0A9E4K699_9GAMM|nr:sulfurtransferase complex subunit TusB [Candidatus Thiodiazotropha lotti]ODC01677.1 tRNA 2-thiouridine(34) synthase TusB [Candidatus Thiodiazotropha endoloripes]MCG7921250.1 sulfurtransferase complex subunit TusB [Candidatus Thiodiazotropha lotti]MCG7930217.1 sulfurtransferase complex subunit TusB [Candidatus Thiodiazotropha lotti]MCG7939853.1 sulfurtransferase complex subunit TusB [Candidatus Thiodiazotropha lotti]